MSEDNNVSNSEEAQKRLVESGVDNTLSNFVSDSGLNKGKMVEIAKKESVDIVDALKLIAPGTQLREAINSILAGRKGALIVVASPDIFELIEGGFKLNCKFTPQRVFELSKMDGAIVLSNDLRKILYSNCLLTPHPLIPSNETGTRHKAAERTAKQAKTLVIAISERKNAITIYYHNFKYALKSTGEVLSRAVEKLAILEKQREIFNNLLSKLNKLEVANLVTTNDISSILQRIEMIIRVSSLIRKNVIELGNEGSLIKIRLRELTKNIDKEKRLILKDYAYDKAKKYQKEIEKVSIEGLIDSSKISEIIFNGEESYIYPKGYRIIEKLNLPSNETETLLGKFIDLKEMFDSNIFEFEKVFRSKDRAEKFMKALYSLKEDILTDREIL